MIVSDGSSSPDLTVSIGDFVIIEYFGNFFVRLPEFPIAFDDSDYPLFFLVIL